MTAPLSNDLRLRVVRAIDGGLSRRVAAAKFDVSIASAVRWYQRYKRTGSVAPEAIGGDRLSHRAETHAAKVLGWVEAQRDITLVEIADRLAEEGHVFAPSTIWRLLDRHGYTLKKDRSRQRAGPRRREGSPVGMVRWPACACTGASCLPR